MVFNSFGHCTCPIIKYNTITHCPMLVDCCVGFVWLVSLHRSSQSLILDPADVTCMHIFIWIAKGMEVNEALQPCIATHTPSYAIPPRIQMVWLIVVFILLSLFPLPSPPIAHFLPRNHMKWGFVGQSNDPHPSSTHDNRSPSPIDCCVCCFGGRRVPLGEAEPPKPPEAGTPTPPFWPKIGRTEINPAPWLV